MSAKPEVIGTIGEDEFVKMRVSTMDGIAIRLNEQENELQSLKKQKAGLLEKIAVLQLQKTEAEIRLQTQLLKVHADYLDRLSALEQSQDRTNNYVQGLPTRDELEAVIAKLKQVGSDFYAHSAGQ